MKTLREQIADGCVYHRSPVHNKMCGAGVNYRELVGGEDLGWMARRPCVRSPLQKEPVAKCAHMRFPTEEEITKEIESIEAWIKQ